MTTDVLEARIIGASDKEIVTDSNNFSIGGSLEIEGRACKIVWAEPIGEYAHTVTLMAEIDNEHIRKIILKFQGHEPGRFHWRDVFRTTYLKGMSNYDEAKQLLEQAGQIRARRTA